MKRKNYKTTIILHILVVLIPVCSIAQGVRLTPGIYMTMNGPVNLVLNNAGLITGGGFKQGTSTIIYTGNVTTVQPLLGSNNTTAFKHVTINRPSNDVVLNGDIVIEGTLTMISGNLQLNNHTLNLAGIITGESNQSHIAGVTGGVVTIAANLNAPQAINPGNIGVELTSAANLGQTVITRGHLQQQLPGGGTGIQRFFVITPTNNIQLNATLRFYYLDTELAGINESALSLWSGADAGGYWLLTGKDSSNTVSNHVLKSGLDHFNSYTLAPETTDQLLRVSNNVTTKASSTDPLKALPTAQTSAQAYPNPLQELFVIALVSNQEKEYVISLYNQYGQLLQSKKPLCRPGMNHIAWDMSDYAKGVYFVVFENDGLKSIKVIKQ